jgi:hypothetical protein
MSKVQTRAGAAARLAYFLWRLSLDLFGIARATKGDVTAGGRKILRNLIAKESKATYEAPKPKQRP